MHEVQVQLVMGELRTELGMQIQMLLMQAQENGVSIGEREIAILCTDWTITTVDADVDEQPLQDLSLNVDNVFQVDDCDAFDSVVEEASTTQTMFMANLSSVDPVYDEASLSYDSDILSKYTDSGSLSGLIYVKDNAVLVVQSNVSSVPNDACMMILNDIYELFAQCISVTTHNNVVDNLLTAELATYKEQIELFTEMHAAYTVVQARCLELEAELSKLLNKVQKDDHTELVKRTFHSRVLATGRYAIDVEPIPPRNRNNREVHLDYLKHIKESVETLCQIIEEAKVERPLDSSLAFACLYTKHSQELLEYAIGTCPKDFNQRDKNHAATPLTRKKQVTFEDQCETSNSNTQTCRQYKKIRNLVGKEKKVEEHPRTNKSSLKKSNHINSSISSKRAVLNLNSRSVCKTCNNCFILENHDMCVVNYLNFVHASPSIKNVISKVKKAWKPKKVWKATGKLLTNVGYQWKPTRRKFILGEQCPLTRLIKSKVVLSKQTENVSTGKIMITEKLSHTSQKPLTRYQRRTKQYKAIPTSFPTLTENEAIDASLHSTVASANQQEPNKNWGSIFLNSPSLSIFKCRIVRFGNDHFGAIMGYRDYVIGDSVISRVNYVEGLGHNLFSVEQFCDSNLKVAFRKHSYMMKSSPICLLSKASKNKSWLWHRRLNHLNFGTINYLARKDLVRGLPRLKFEKYHLCSACQLGKSKKHTHTPKIENANLEVPNTLHMDLCGPMLVQTINGKKYILVIVDDYSRFTWVKFLRSKDETPEFVIKFLKQIQVGLNKTVRYICTDNGTEFVSQVLTKYYESVGIFQQKSVPRTPHQNGVVERRNRTLVEAARTMLIFSKALMFYGQKLLPLLISSGLVPNPVLAAPYVPATNKDLEILFQLMFDEYLEPRSAERLVSSATAVQVPVISAGTPSSTTIDQDAPSPSHSPSSSGLQPPISHQGVAAGSTIIEDNPFAHADNDPFVDK
ncbi:retrovirus-related pol polyprotein from transposon TNT 1-94 [Tanacetum coccineum]|uniref:Retrovirus-related pol polyprotein from transposon TNT 1-94 n=1 Tax=Tanacetum coccineum TaxID=301880 RepID=A0ABQ5IGI8_9ASTR